MTPRHAQAGFTLLEMLVAIALFAVVAGGFMAAGRQALTQMQRMEDKTIAGWVAENTMAEIRAARGWPEVGNRNNRVTLGGRDWEVRVRIQPSANADMRRLDVSVLAEASEDVLFTLTGYLGRH